jgi:phage shock protein C
LSIASGRTPNRAKDFTIMTDRPQNLFTRDDTFFGVCEALGEDLHIPPNLLRIAMAPLLIWNPVATFIGYLAVGCVIALIRLVFPNRRKVAAAAATPEQVLPALEEIEFAKAA